MRRVLAFLAALLRKGSLLALASAIAGFLAPVVAWGQPQPAPAISQIRANPSGTRGAAGINPRYYTPRDFGAKMDARQFWAQCAMTAGAAVLTCGTTTSVTANATTTAGSHTITASSFAGTLVGQYVTASGLGAAVSGTSVVPAPYSSLVLGASATIIQSADAVQQSAAAQSTTFNFNSLFDTVNDPGRTIKIGMPGITNIGSPSTAPYSATINACSSANSCTLSVNATSTIPGGYNDWVLITIGTDDSNACTATVQAALSRGDRYIVVGSGMLVPTCTKQLEWVIPTGDGALYFPPVRRYVIPLDAGPPAPPKNTITPKLHFKNTAAQIVSSGSAKCVVTGDSLNQIYPAIIDPAATLPMSIFRRLSDVAPKVLPFERAVGGYTETLFDATPAGIGANNSYAWGQTTTTSWLGSNATPTGYIYALAPDCLIIGFGNNDAQLSPYTPTHLYNYVANIQSWTHPVDILFALSWPKDIGSAAATQDQFDSITMFRRTFAEVNGLGFLDFNKTAVQYRDGYDPTRPALVAFPFTPTNQNGGNFSLNSYIWPVATSGYVARQLLGSTAPLWFAAAVSTSPTGVGEIMWQVGCNLTATAVCGDNIVRVGIDNTAQGGGNTGNAYVECDPSNLYPGAGCHGAGLAVPVVYTPMLTVTMAAAGNALSTTTATFAAGDEGLPLVVPLVGPAMQNAFNDYLLCNMHFVDTTHVTCFTNAGHGTPANATNAVTSKVMALGRGNPHIVSGYAITGDAVANPQIGITVNGDYFDVWYEDPNQFLVSGHVVRYGGAFQPKMWWTGTAGAGTNKIYFNAGGFMFIEQPSAKLTTPLLTSWEVNGPPIWTGDASAGPISTIGGGAENHPTFPFGAMVITPVVDAANLCVTCQ